MAGEKDLGPCLSLWSPSVRQCDEEAGGSPRVGGFDENRLVRGDERGSGRSETSDLEPARVRVRPTKTPSFGETGCCDG